MFIYLQKEDYSVFALYYDIGDDHFQRDILLAIIRLRLNCDLLTPKYDHIPLC